MSGRELEQWVIYDHPRDFPEHVVVRCWRIGPNRIDVTPEVWLRPDLDAARQVVAANSPGAYCFPRMPEDDPAILEVWV